MNLKLCYLAVFFLFFGIFVSVSVLPLYQLLILVPCFYYLKKDFKKDPIKKSQIFLALLILVTIISNIVNFSDLELKVKAFLKVKFYLLGLLAIYPLNRLAQEYLTVKRARFLLNTLWFVLIAACIYGVTKSKLGFDLLKMESGDFNWRSSGFTGIMRYGYGSGMVISIMVGLWLNRAKLTQLLGKYYFPLAIIAAFIGLYASMCRGALLGLICAIPISLYFYKKKLGYYFAGISMLLVLFLASASFVGGSNKSRFLMKMKSNSNMMRLSQYQSALYAIKEKPVLGFGNLQFSFQVPRIKQKYDLGFKEFASHAHNIFLEAGANTGLLGLVALAGFFFFWFLEMYRGNYWQRQLMIPFLVALLVSAQFEHLFDANNSSLIFFLYPLSFVKLPKSFLTKG